MSTYDIAGGLRSPELIILQRALTAYIGAYNAIKSGRADGPGKTEAQEYIDAAVALGNRLRINKQRHVDRDRVVGVYHAIELVLRARSVPKSVKPGIEAVAKELLAALEGL